MTTKTAKGPVSVSNTAELRVALVAGYSADEIAMPDHTAALSDARAEGHADGLATGRAEGKSQNEASGAARELQRIKDVAAQTLPGHEALVRELMFDGKTTGAEAAARVITAERDKRGKRLEDLEADAAAAHAPVAAAPADRQQKPVVDKNLPVEDRCKVEWQHDPQLRADFGTVEEYIAYTRATEGGHVRILRDRSAKK